jgi:hypothetical protein
LPVPLEQLDDRIVRLGLTLPGEKGESVTHWSVALPAEEQTLRDALAGLEDTIGQEHADIRITAFGGPVPSQQLRGISVSGGFHEKLELRNFVRPARERSLIRPSLGREFVSKESK